MKHLIAPFACALFASCLLAPCAPAHAADGVRSAALNALESGLRPAVLEPSAALPRWSLAERMAYHHVPGVAIAILEDGKVVQTFGFGTRAAGSQEPVDADTLFNVGSVSKILAAATALRLVAQERIELDRDVNTYLKSWRIPPAPRIANAQVTLRMLLSHTSGLSEHGFDDFAPGDAVPTLLESLDGKRPATNGPIRLQREPGLLGDYSGGGYTVAQQLLEDVAGAPLETIAKAQVFDPLGMTRSTFASPLPAARGNIAKAHDEHGKPTALPRGWQTFPQEAAAGLWTSANDLGAFVGALIRSYQGDDDFLPHAIAIDMMTEVSPSWHGLGPRLDGAGNARIFHHGGSNDSYRAWIEGYLETGDGFVILTNGANGGTLRTEIRNALSDAIGLGVNPPLRVIALDPASAKLADYAGHYRADATVPLDVRRSLTDFFEVESFEIQASGGALSLKVPGESGALLPLTPNRFIAPTVFGTEYEFHRDAHGRVRAVSVLHGTSRAYFRREPSSR